MEGVRAYGGFDVMAKIRTGPMVAQISGSIAGTTFSHNRYGAYARSRSIPVTSTTSYALQAKARLAQASQSWQDLTDAQRNTWSAWAGANPITDRLGERQVLSGHTAFVMLNRRILQIPGTMIDAPPISEAPEPLLTLTGSYDIGAGTFELAFTPAALGASERLCVYAALVNSPGINYIENYRKLVSIEAAATASPVDLTTEIETRLGSMTVGQTLIYEAYVLDEDTGLISSRLRTQGVIITTP